MKSIRAANPGQRASSGKPEEARRVRESALFLGLMMIVALILTAIAATGSTAPGDAAIASAVQSLPGGESLEEAADLLASLPVECLIWLIGVGIAWRTKSGSLLIASFVVLLALGVNPLIKELVERSRPSVAQLTVREAASGYGFPSGHTQTATLVYGFLFCSLRSTTSQIGRWTALGSVCAIALIGLDRVYNGVHWPSDVFAGFAFGVLLLAIALGAGHLLAKITHLPAPSPDGRPRWQIKR